MAPMTTVAELQSGKVRGARRAGVTIFKGIPYGEPAGGAQRFRPPRKTQGWSGVRDALEFGEVCPQDVKASQPDPSTIFGQMFEADPSMLHVGEDCLSLNVWTPGVDAEQRPVMVWLHGGGFARGCGSTPLIDGSRLSARGNAVIVTLNHRLNVFGHLYLGEFDSEYEHSGNSGMHDIVLALEWVRDNIAAFGGDPGNVTIFGESGGGGKVLAMLSMPAACGLFHRAIVQSGPFVHANTRERSAKTAHALLAELGLTKATLSQIETVPWPRMVEASLATEAKMQGVRILDGSMGCWQPMIDERDLPHHPGDPRSHALFPDVPLVIGTTKDELAMHFSILPNFASLSLEEAGQICAMVSGEPMADALAFYRELRPDEPPGYLMTGLLGDLGAWYPTVRLTEGRSTAARAPVFHYVLGWETPVLGGCFRSPHALDIPLMFDNVERTRAFVGDGPQPQTVADAMSESWLAFARSGVPDNTLIPSWPTYSTTRRTSMVFDVKSEVVEDYNAPVRKFWSHRKTAATERPSAAWAS
jgi:para-nitrobenzyl esterase